jgi:cytochrome c oxidase cbb3-type subunit 2
VGRGSYVSHGCFYCHTQQVRDPQYGPDLERGWGVRRTVARDYIFEDVPLLGSMRLGPDFANYGSPTWRNEPPNDPKSKPPKRDADWLYRHLFNPKIIESKSICPPMTHLFVRQEIGESVSPHAAHVDGRYEWIPTAEARELAAYLLAQNRSFVIGKEAPVVITPKEEKK